MLLTLQKDPKCKLFRQTFQVVSYILNEAECPFSNFSELLFSQGNTRKYPEGIVNISVPIYPTF